MIASPLRAIPHDPVALAGDLNRLHDRVDGLRAGVDEFAWRLARLDARLDAAQHGGRARVLVASADRAAVVRRRTRLGLSQTALGQEAHYARGVVSDWETGRRPDWGGALARAFEDALTQIERRRLSRVMLAVRRAAPGHRHHRAREGTGA